jgi:hypothetical protein
MQGGPTVPVLCVGRFNDSRFKRRLACINLVFDPKIAKALYHSAQLACPGMHTLRKQLVIRDGVASDELNNIFSAYQD